jgi:hypothetical protein
MSYECRICYEGASRRHPLIRPCFCEGSIAHTHRKCIDQWIRQKEDRGDEMPYECESCLYLYQCLTLDQRRRVRQFDNEMDEEKKQQTDDERRQHDLVARNQYIQGKIDQQNEDVWHVLLWLLGVIAFSVWRSS